MKRWIVLLTAAAVMAASATHAAEGKEGKDRPGKGGPEGGRHFGEMGLLPPKLQEELNLTADQAAKVKDLDAKFAKDRDDWKAAHKDQEAETAKLREQMKAAHDAGDKDKLKELGAQMREQYKPLMELRKKYMDQLQEILNADQKEKLGAARERFGARGKPGGPDAK